MTFDVGPVEAFWLAVNVITFVLTFTALLDARVDRDAAKALNGHAREIAADDIVDQERLATIAQVILIGVVVPQLFSDREIVLTPAIVALMALPVVLFYMSLKRARTRRRLIALVADEQREATNDAFARLDSAIAENTRISQQASDRASDAYHEANTVNEKLAAQGEDRRATTEAISETLEDTHEKTVAIHDVVVKPEGKT